jgi:hypothetical protein
MITALLLAARVSLAAVPAWVAPVVEPLDVVSQYREHAARSGRSGAEATLACRNFAEDLLLCFRWKDGAVTRRLTDADLRRLGVSLAEVEKQATALSEAAMDASRLRARTVEGVEGSYFVAEVGDGLDAAPFLAPEALERLVGPSPVLASPADGVVLAWVPGRSELDTVVAVGLRRAHDGADHPVSARAYQWDGGAWVVWGEAVPAPAP